MTDLAVVLAAGRGSRLRSAIASVALSVAQEAAVARGIKALVPVGPAAAERAILDYILATLSEAGIRRVVLVTSPEGTEPIRHHVERLDPSPLSVRFALQAVPRGTADALLAAREEVSEEPFLVLGCDTWMPAEVIDRLRRQEGFALPAFVRERLLCADTNLDDERLRGFAVLDVDAYGRLRRIREKPRWEVWSTLEEPVLLSLNAWRFEPAIFDACAQVAPSPRGELELPAAVQRLIDRGQRIDAHLTRARALDLTHRGDAQALAPLLAGVPALR